MQRLFTNVIFNGTVVKKANKDNLQAIMTRYEILSFLESDDATAGEIGSHFSLPRSYVYSRLTILNRQGLITKRKAEDGVLHFGLTNRGREKLEWIEEREDSEEDEENFLENKPGGGTMKVTLNLEDDVYEALKDCASENKEKSIADAAENIVTDYLIEEGFLEDEEDEESEDE